MAQSNGNRLSVTPRATDCWDATGCGAVPANARMRYWPAAGATPATPPLPQTHGAFFALFSTSTSRCSRRLRSFTVAAATHPLLKAQNYSALRRDSEFLTGERFGLQSRFRFLHLQMHLRVEMSSSCFSVSVSWQRGAVYRGRSHTVQLSFAMRRHLVCCVISNDGHADCSKCRITGNATRPVRALDVEVRHSLHDRASIGVAFGVICPSVLSQLL